MTEQAIEWKPYRPSNGTEGDVFRADWCDKCERDRENRETGAGGCPIIVYTMAYELTDPKYPKEWRRRADATEYPGAECTAFVPEGESLPEPRCTLTKELF